ncbi:MAG: hypothetical protein M3Q69_02700 [Acidobacteriota bacterium]|nr:hypothetical protein [Acidobacteriota bacterium]
MLKTRLTLKPGRPGTKRLFAEYGSRLVCVRYRYDEELQTRCKTIELIIEEVPWRHTLPPQPQPDDIVHVRIRFEEEAIRDALKRRGAIYSRETKTWITRYEHALALRLVERIVVPRALTAGPV